MSNDGGARSLGYNEPLIYDRSRPGCQGALLGTSDVPESNLEAQFPSELLRKEAAALPELAEPDVVRHYTRLSTWNFSVDHGFYPLGSCTMKYNPKLNEWAARLPGFAQAHPYAPTQTTQGQLALMVSLEQMLAEITGLNAVSLQPAAGAHGEMTALMVIAAAQKARGAGHRKVVLIPDTAHGTNPASAAMNGFVAKEVPSNEHGFLTKEAVARAMDDQVAALMLTNPNTLGLFEPEIAEVCDLVHQRGGFVFGDGANLNAIMGKSRPGDYGIDAMHINLHKTFSTPHGGGGPGAGPVAVGNELTRFLPGPRPIQQKDGTYGWAPKDPQSIGRVRSFYGNFGVLVRAYVYIRSLGAKGLKAASEMAVLNANYLLHLIKDTYHIPYGNGRCMHEVVASDKNLHHDTGVSTLDVAKGLIDRGFHPPTVYFPLVVKGALMCEPTETESAATIESFADALIEIDQQARKDPDALHLAPKITRLGRLDETLAARKPQLKAPE